MDNSIGVNDVIAYVESKGDPYAYRFEPATYSKLANPTVIQSGILRSIQGLHNCSMASAMVIYSSSFGKYQIMGFNLYGTKLSLASSAFIYMANTPAQDAMFATFIKSVGLDSYTAQALADDPLARQHFGAVYNGNGSAYANMIAQALNHYGFTVKG